MAKPENQKPDPHEPEPPPPGQPQPKQEQKQAKQETPEQRNKRFGELAKTQSKARADLRKKQAEAAEKGDDDAKAKAKDSGVKEMAELKKKQKAERAEADPTGMMPRYHGYELQEAVAALHAELSALAAEHQFEVSELRAFGLGFDIFDPITGVVTSPARPHRRDIGETGLLLTAEAVISDIESSRRHQAGAGVTTYASDHVMADIAA